MSSVFHLFKYTLIGSAALGTVFSLRANHYDVNSIGIVRLSRASLKVCDIAYMYHSNLYKQKYDKNSIEYRKIKSECHWYGAQKLLEICCLNKGVFIKVGQHIGALDYLMPKEYVETMRVLHNNAPKTNLEDIYKVIQEDFKKEPSEIFTHIESEPVGVASLAQVHIATLKNGERVAVKVQHPYVRGNSIVDMKTMEFLVKVVSWIFPDFKFQWLVDETKKNIPQELDFVQEGKNAEKVSKLFQKFNWLSIPKIYWDLTTSRVLTMEFMEGGHVNDLEYIKNNNINPYEISIKLGRLYSQMIFIDGFVHSDPHPGNILVKKTDNGRVHIILLDHGLYAHLSNELRCEYSKLWLSILNHDTRAMRLHSSKLGIHGNMYGLFACMITGRTWDNIITGIQKSKQTTSETNVLRKELPNFLPQISGVLDSVNRQLILILKTNDLMRGIEYNLNTQQQMASFMIMSKCCVRSVYKEQLKNANGLISKFKISISEKWTLFTLSLYYIFHSFKSFTVLSTIQNLLHS